MLQQGVGVYVPGAVDHVCNSAANPGRHPNMYVTHYRRDLFIVNGVAPSPLDVVQIDTVGNDSSSLPNAFIQDTAPPAAPYSIIRPIAANETEAPLRPINRIQIGQGQPPPAAPSSTLNQLPTTPAPAFADNDNDLLLADGDDDLADQQSPVATTVANAPPRTHSPISGAISQPGSENVSRIRSHTTTAAHPTAKHRARGRRAFTIRRSSRKSNRRDDSRRIVTGTNHRCTR